VKKALGLQASKIRVTGAAPISLTTLEYFMSLDMPLLELYGMSETSGEHLVHIQDVLLSIVPRNTAHIAVPSDYTKSIKPHSLINLFIPGPHTMNIVGATKVGSVGVTLLGAETRIHKPDAKGEGEICMRGRHVFAG
jgi:long-chain-fatty-acid--CoA ligase ACSBG